MWLVFVAACVAIGPSVHLRKVSDVDTTVGQAGQAARLLHEANLDDPTVENVLITAKGVALDPSVADAVAAEVIERMRRLPDVASVGAPQTASSHQAVLVQITMRGSPDTADDRVSTLLDTTAAVQARHPYMRVEQVGRASLDKAINKQVGSDLATAANVSLPITLLIMLVAFGAIIAAGVPVLLALTAVASATGLSSIVSLILPDSGTTSSMILLMGMAVGVDYSLFYVKRAREERARGASKLDSIELAARTSGHSVVVSGAAVIVSMLGLLLARDAVFSSLAAGSILVVGVAVLGSVTVLPAVLAKLGRLIDRPRVPVLWRLSMRSREPRLWPALLRPAMRYPAQTLAISVSTLVILATPALGLSLHSDTPEGLPQSISAVQSFDRLTKAFPSTEAITTVVVKAPAAQADVVSARLEALRASLDPSRFDRSSSSLRASSDATVHELRLDVPGAEDSVIARQGLGDLRGTAVAGALRGVPHASWAVGGDTARQIDYDSHLADRMRWVVEFVVGLTMLMMSVTFRSIAIALMTAAMNMLSAGAALGVLVLTFQHSWAQSLLDFRSTGTVVSWIPLFTFAVLFGLSMDYHVFVVSRIREAAATGMSTREAVRYGITHSAGTVTSAAFVMVSVFTIFASLHMVEMKEIGIGLVVAVLVDALIVRIIVLPAAMILLGRANWWPGHLRRPAQQVVRAPQVLVEARTR